MGNKVRLSGKSLKRDKERRERVDLEGEQNAEETEVYEAEKYSDNSIVIVSLQDWAMILYIEYPYEW